MRLMRKHNRNNAFNEARSTITSLTNYETAQTTYKIGNSKITELYILDTDGENHNSRLTTITSNANTRIIPNINNPDVQEAIMKGVHIIAKKHKAEVQEPYKSAPIAEYAKML